jgi:transposase
MSKTLLYRMWGIRGYEYVSTSYGEGGACFRVEQDPSTFRCACCGSYKVEKSGVVTRRFRTVPVGGKPVTVELPIQRLLCLACGKTRQSEVGFADARRGYTRSFERYVLDLSRHMSIKAVAKHLGVGWDTVKDIQKRNLHRRFRKPRLKHLRRIAIDEISVGKGQQYLTTVLDLDDGAVVFVGKGKGADALDPFWKRLRGSGAKIKAVATDMSAAYTAAVKKNLPKAIHVYDRFHVVKLFNEKLSNLRRDVQRDAETALQKAVLKGTRWLLLKNPENLDRDKGEHQRLEEALGLNKPLATAYYLKEDLRQLWEKPNKREAGKFLTDWLARARASGIAMLKKFARTLEEHRSGILAYYDCPITTAALEGTNNKIRTMQRQAYGFRDQEFFQLKIYALHETTYALVG